MQVLARVKAVATDIDDAMTERGLLWPDVLFGGARTHPSTMDSTAGSTTRGSSMTAAGRSARPRLHRAPPGDR